MGSISVLFNVLILAVILLAPVSFLGLSIVRFITYKKKVYLFMLMLSLSWLFLMFFIFFIFSRLNQETRIHCIMIFTWTMFFTHFIFVQNIYRIRLVTFNRIVLPVLMLQGYLVPCIMASGYLQDYTWLMIKIMPASLIILITWLSYTLHRIIPDLKIITNAIFFILPLILFFYKTVYISSYMINHIVVFFCMILPFMFGIGLLVLHTSIWKKISHQECVIRTTHAATGSESEIVSQHSDIIDRAIAYIHGNYMEPINREDIAEDVGISPDYCGKLFLKYTGKSIKEYINIYRTHKAALIIGETDTRFLEIAYEVGFDCLATFNRYFLKIYGMPPRRYRKTNGTRLNSSMIKAVQAPCRPGQ